MSGKDKAGELNIGNADAYVDTFVRRAIEMVWGGRKDIIRMYIPWTQQVSDNSVHRNYRGNVHVEHDGVEIVMCFYIKLSAGFNRRSSNIFGWEPYGYLACEIRSIRELKGVSIKFNNRAAEGRMTLESTVELPIEATPDDNHGNLTNLAKVRAALGLQLELAT